MGSARGFVDGPRLFSRMENIMISDMENKGFAAGEPAVSLEEARESLREASSVISVASWRQQRWAAVVMAVPYAVMIAVASWESLIGLLATFSLFAVLLWLLRRRLWNPLVRAQRRQDPFSGIGEQGWFLALWPMWMPMAIIVPGSPRWIGVLVGIVAGIFAYLGLRRLGELSR